MNKLTLIPDIYEISNTVDQVQQTHMDGISQDTLSMGIFGYMNCMFSDSLQNSIVMATEWGNEAFPIKAKFKKNILTNAITYGVNNINAQPATIDVMLGFIISEIESFFTKDTFTIYNDTIIKVGDAKQSFEYRLDYDVILSRDITNKQTNYSARYNIQTPNPISDITNPYLPPPVSLTMNNDLFVFITCKLRQVKYDNIYKTIISNNILENKTFDFTYTDQLAAFTIEVESEGVTTILNPVYEGLPPNGIKDFCYYTYLDEQTIRIKFTRESYDPKINSKVTVKVQNTQGSKGNFIYRDNVIETLQSENFNYRGLNMLLKPVSPSTNGIDRKSIDDIKSIIPKEILSRGNIINNKDLENFFNSIDSTNKLHFYRRRDNQQTRLFYAYMLVKDDNDNVIPTNTINMTLNESDFNNTEDGRLLLNPGYIAQLNNWMGSKVDMTNEEALALESDPNNFVYSTPFSMVVNTDPLCISYYLNEINRDYQFKFSYINQQADLQFIANKINIYKNYLSDNKNDFKITLDVVQNMNVDKKMVITETDNTGEIVITKCLIKPAIVLETNGYKYYAFGELVDYNKSNFSYKFEFILKTDNIINRENKIKINDMFVGGSTAESAIYFPSSIAMSFYMFAELDDNGGLGNSATIIPGMDKYTLCNIYETNTPVDLFYNYSNVMKSKVTVSKSKAGDNVYQIDGVPVVRYSYINDEERCNDVLDYVQYRKAYIDEALNVIENSFSVDLKYFNTYGPSKMFRIGDPKSESLNRVNLTLNFRIKLYIGADKHTKEYITEYIKSYVESINIRNYIHMSNIITDVTNTYSRDIEFIEFVSINDYPTNLQYLFKTQTEIISDVPEFLNINLSDNMVPDINITLV